MEVSRLHVGGFSLLLLSLMALNYACVDGKYSSFFYNKDHFSAQIPNLLEELH